MTLVTLYALLVLAAEIPAVQRYFAQSISRIVGEVLHTRVDIKGVGIGLFNRVILHDVTLYDQSGKVMLQGKRLSAKISWRDLRHHLINIRTLELIDVQAQLYKAHAHTPTNFQFVLDAFASEDTTHTTHTDLRINSLIMRRTTVRYDQLDRPRQAHQLDPAHLYLTQINANLSLKALRRDSLNLRIRELRLHEQSGLQIDRLAGVAAVGARGARFTGCTLHLPHSQIQWDTLQVGYRQLGVFRLANLQSLRVQLHHSYVTPADVQALYPPLRTWQQPLQLSAHVQIDPQRAVLHQLALSTPDEGLTCMLQATADAWQDERRLIRVNLQQLQASATYTARLYHTLRTDSIPPLLRQLGRIEVMGSARYYKGNTSAHLTTHTSVGSLFAEGTLFASRHFTLQASTDGIDLYALTRDKRLGHTQGTIQAKGEVSKERTMVQFATTLPNVFLQGYQYQHTKLTGTWTPDRLEAALQLQDVNAQASVQATLQGLQHKPKNILLKAQVKHLNPAALHLTQQYGPQAYFQGELTAHAMGTSLQDVLGEVHVTGLALHQPDQVYRLQGLHLRAQQQQGEHLWLLHSDFAQGTLRGHIDPKTLLPQLMMQTKRDLPTLLQGVQTTQTNNFSLQIQWHKGDVLQHLLGLPIQLHHTATLQAQVSAHDEAVWATLTVPQIQIAGESLHDIHLYAKRDTGATNILLQGVRKTQKSEVKIEANVQARQDHIHSFLGWRDLAYNNYSGEIQAMTNFVPHPQEGIVAVTQLLPTDVTIHDTVWQVLPAKVTASKERVMVDGLGLTHQDQLIQLRGGYGQAVADTMRMQLNRIDLTYLLDLLNFHAVDFSGFATGTVLLGKASPGMALGGDLRIDQFHFNGTNMGTLQAHAQWNNVERQIDIDADILGAQQAKAHVKGFVSPTKNGLDLHFDTQHTTLNFLNRYLDDIFSDLDGTGTGWCRLYGKFSDLNLQGEEVVQMRARANALGVTYQVNGDTVRLSHGRIDFPHVTVHDKYGKQGKLTGYVTHEYLRDMRFDFSIKMDTLLCYDFANDGDIPFYGTVYATGNAHLQGRPGSVVIDTDIKAEYPTRFTYNASKPSEVNDDNLLVLRDITPRAKRPFTPFAQTTTPQAAQHTLAIPHDTQTPQQGQHAKSDLYLNFLIDATPEAELQIIMDEKSGDDIRFHGTGNLRATFYNKGKFQLYGTYTIDDGLYRLSIQDIIRKNFKFKPGGTINFRGEPYDGDLQLHAAYTVNSVSLNELSDYQNFSNNNVKVDCLLNIEGKVAQPHITFDLDLPTVSDEEKQMVRNLISTDEERNMQVIYLLGIGRFYTVNAANAGTLGTGTQSQSAVAVSSLLTNTLSTQLNDVLTSALNTQNWTFGTNLTPGRDGWNDLEVDGLLSGRLLNNRLLFNGNFGYRESTYYNTGFVGDFNLQWLLTPGGDLSLKAYSETNDRYFTKSSLRTQGIGLVYSKDFTRIRDLLGIKKRKPKPLTPTTTQKP